MPGPAAKAAEEWPTGGRILIVDDQEDVRLMLQTVLSLDGWETEAAASGQEAVGRIGRTPHVDVVVVDYKMPGLDGVEVARRIRRSGFEQPIIICSAYVNPQLERDASALEAHTVSKDDLQDLQKTIRRRVLGSARENRAAGAIESSDDAAGRKVAERRARAILETAHEAFVAIDQSGAIIDWNPHAERTFGWTRAEALGRPLAKTLIPPRYREAHARGLARFLATGEATIIGKPLELEALHRDGREFPVELTVTALDADVGLQFNAFIRDISDRTQTERDLQKALAREASRLRDLDRLKDEFLSIVSHELRTPLTVIAALAEVLNGSPERADRDHLLERIFENASQMSAMIEQLLDYSRLDAGKVTLQLGALPLRDAVLRCLELVPGLGERQTSLEVPAELTVRADARGFERILVNLLTNAAKFSAEGSSIVVSARAENGQATIAVEDEGIGIPPEDRERVFDRFYRGATVSGERGTGIGLSIVRRYVELFGGTVWAKSAPGKGAQLVFTLPLSSMPETGAA